MAFGLKDIKPAILGGVNFKESPTFIDTPAHLKEFIEIQLGALSKKKGKNCRFEVSIKEGDIVASFKAEDNEELIIAMDKSSINFVQTEVSDFHFFNEDVPSLLYAILNHIDRKNVDILGMMFRTINLLPKKDINVISNMKNSCLSLKPEHISNLKIKEEDITRLNYELKFIEGPYLRNIDVKAEEEKEGCEVSVSLDTRFDKEITNKEMEIKNAAVISEFFEKSALAYFSDCIVNGVAKDIFELIIKESAEK